MTITQVLCTMAIVRYFGCTRCTMITMYVGDACCDASLVMRKRNLGLSFKFVWETMSEQLEKEKNGIAMVGYELKMTSLAGFHSGFPAKQHVWRR